MGCSLREQDFGNLKTYPPSGGHFGRYLISQSFLRLTLVSKLFSTDETHGHPIVKSQTNDGKKFIDSYTFFNTVLLS